MQKRKDEQKKKDEEKFLDRSLEINGSKKLQLLESKPSYVGQENFAYTQDEVTSKHVSPSHAQREIEEPSKPLSEYRLVFLH